MFSYPVFMRWISSGVGGVLAANAGLDVVVMVRRAVAMVDPARLKMSRREDVAWIAVEEAVQVRGTCDCVVVKADVPAANVATTARMAVLELTMIIFFYFTRYYEGIDSSKLMSCNDSASGGCCLQCCGPLTLCEASGRLIGKIPGEGDVPHQEADFG